MCVLICKSFISNNLGVFFRAGGEAGDLRGKAERKRRISVYVFSNENVTDARLGNVNKIEI